MKHTLYNLYIYIFHIHNIYFIYLLKLVKPNFIVSSHISTFLVHQQVYIFAYKSELLQGNNIERVVIESSLNNKNFALNNLN